MDLLFATRLFGVLFWAAAALVLQAAEAPPAPAAPPVSKTGEGPIEKVATDGLWPGGVGEGFGPSAQDFGVEAGASHGVAAFGGTQAHNLSLMSLTYGHILGRVKGQGHWFRGNWEFRAELFGGAEFSPDTEWLVGLAPHLRYNFATGTRLVPFVDAGAGATGTGIGPPDLSNTFEFNLQAAVGLHWFIKDDVALTVEARYVHFSCAGISSPNRGLNTLLGLVGVNWFF
jgi:hypothetical protein